MENQRVPQFLAGDVVLFAGEGDLYSKVGRWLMRGPTEGPTYAVHTAQFVGPRSVLEMDFKARVKSVDDVLNRRYRFDMWKRRGFEVWRCQALSDTERQALAHQALTYTSVRFGMLKFLEHLFDGLISKAARRDIFLLRRLDWGYPVCSEMTSMVYDKALGYRFGVPPECADPDHIHDWLVTHPEEWVCVFALEDYSQRTSLGERAQKASSPVRGRTAAGPGPAPSP